MHIICLCKGGDETSRVALPAYTIEIYLLELSLCGGQVTPALKLELGLTIFTFQRLPGAFSGYSSLPLAGNIKFICRPGFPTTV
jgi:hypothetical protein